MRTMSLKIGFFSLLCLHACLCLFAFGWLDVDVNCLTPHVTLAEKELLALYGIDSAGCLLAKVGNLNFSSVPMLPTIPAIVVVGTFVLNGGD